jgi:hypothetical protein
MIISHNAQKAPKGEQLMYSGCINKGTLKQQTKTEKVTEEKEAGTQIPKSKLQKRTSNKRAQDDIMKYIFQSRIMLWSKDLSLQSFRYSIINNLRGYKSTFSGLESCKLFLTR